MANDGKVLIDVDLDDKGFKSSLSKMDKDAKKSFDGINKSIIAMGKGAADVGIAIGKSFIAGAVGVVALAESTREFRGDLAKLETNAKQTGTSMDELSDHMAYLQAVTGETDSNVEGLANLMQSGFDDAQIAEVVNSLAGAVTAFPDTLKFEGLADGLQETIATGKGMGQFGELLERTGVDIDVFNAEMESATDEVERQNIAMEYLAKTGMAEVNEAYKENNASLIAAEQAQYKLTEQLARVGEIVDPLVTLFKVDMVDALETMIDAYENEGLTGLADSTSDIVNNIVTEFSQKAPEMIDVGFEFINSLLQGLSENGVAIGDGAAKTIVALRDGLLENIPILLDAAGEILLGFGQGIIDAIPEMIEELPIVMIEIAESLSENIDKVLGVALELLEKLADELVKNIPELLEAAPIIMTELYGAIIRNLPKILAAALRIVLELAAGIIQNLPEIARAGFDMIVSLVSALSDNLFKVFDIAGEIVAELWDTITNTNWLQLGRDIISSIIDGVSEMAETLFSIARGIVDKIMNIFSDIFGIEDDFESGRDYGQGQSGSGGSFSRSGSGGSGTVGSTQPRGAPIGESRGRTERFSSPYQSPQSSSYNSTTNNDNNINVYVDYHGTGIAEMDAVSMGRAIGANTQLEFRRRGLTPV